MISIIVGIYGLVCVGCVIVYFIIFSYKIGDSDNEEHSLFNAMFVGCLISITTFIFFYIDGFDKVWETFEKIECYIVLGAFACPPLLLLAAALPMGLLILLLCFWGSPFILIYSLFANK